MEGSESPSSWNRTQAVGMRDEDVLKDEVEGAEVQGDPGRGCVKREEEITGWRSQLMERWRQKGSQGWKCRGIREEIGGLFVLYLTLLFLQTTGEG